MEKLSVYRSENKYCISYAEAMSICNRLNVIIDQDLHSEGQAYMVRSLYYDSLNNIDFSTKLAGTEIRKKIRLRIYSLDDMQCKLEMKHKNGNLQHKVSLILPRSDAEEIVRGNYSVLVRYFSQSETAAYIYKTMVLGGYHPVALIEYNRIAYTYPHYDTRITFDMNIRSSESCFDLFSPSVVYNTILNEGVILEVKYNEKLMKFISDILKPYHLNQISTSKYCLGRNVFYNYFY